MSLPFLSAYDPPGTSEGTLDPLGLYQIADQLGVKLVPGVRERMQRVRFLTAMAVGARLCEGLETDGTTAPFLVWEWIVIESLIRQFPDDPDAWGLPGSLVTRRALDRHKYLDERSYLKTPRIFGFHGVYKRLATHLDLLDTHLGLRDRGERLIDAWARDGGRGGVKGVRPMLDRWRGYLRRCLERRPPRTVYQTGEDWRELAEAVRPFGSGAEEKRYLRELLLAEDSDLGALPHLWALQSKFEEEKYSDKAVQVALARSAPAFGALLEAIQHYESFARPLQDAFERLLVLAQRPDALGFSLAQVAGDGAFEASIKVLPDRWLKAKQTIGEVDAPAAALFDERFERFSAVLSPAEAAGALCEHHESVQKGKSAEGKRPWFDRLGAQKIYVRHRYRLEDEETQPQRARAYVHDYRAWPIRRFWRDLGGHA